MSIHFASRCLTSSGAGPTSLRQDNADRSHLGRMAEGLVCQECRHVCSALCTFAISDTCSTLKIKKGNRKTTVRQFLRPHGNRWGRSPWGRTADRRQAVDSNLFDCQHECVLVYDLAGPGSSHFWLTESNLNKCWSEGEWKLFMRKCTVRTFPPSWCFKDYYFF